MTSASDVPYVAALKRASETIKTLLAENARLKGPSPIAIVGIACRFPGGANSPGQFWDLLADGRDAVGPVPPDRWNTDRWWDANPDSPGKLYIREGAFLDDVKGFDPAFFNMTPKEAQALDPQQRLLLEMSWEAFDASGVDVRRLAGSRAGVFIGLSNYDYIQAHIHSGDPTRIDAYSGSGAMFSTAAGRLAYFYDFKGPCLTVDTACSSSLVALDLAVKSLRRGECDVALAGGISLILSPDSTVALCKVKALAADGRSRAFDDDATGYGRGEGGGLLVLKRLDDARRDGDRIQAVLAGSAVNHDGRSNGLTAPNGLAQQQVIRDALADAGLSPDAIDYVEAHGTGTPLGDPIEFGALRAVFGRRSSSRPLWMGSVKTNIGHTEAAAGIAGVIKVVLALRHRRLPKSLHFSRPNHHIDWDSASIQVVAEARDWTDASGPRTAGISSFGLSGTNAHVILTEPQEAEEPAATVDRSGGVHVLPLSAATGTALRAVAERWRERLAAASADEAADLCHAAARRPALRERLVVSGRTVSELAAALSSLPEERFARSLRRLGTRGVVFLFGGGQQGLATAGRTLTQCRPSFRAAFERTDPQQPALYRLQVALAALWVGWGVRPAAVIGCEAGVKAAAEVAGRPESEGGTLPFYSATRDRLPEVFAAARAAGYDTFVEIGPSADLIQQLRDGIGQDAGLLVDSLNPEADEDGHIVSSLAALWENGIDIDWTAFGAPRPRRKVEAPTYPFQRHPYWLDVAPVRPAGAAAQAAPARPADPADHKQEAPSMDKTVRIIGELVAIVAEISGFPVAEIDPCERFSDMGLDSLMLVRLGQVVEKTYGVEAQTSQLFAALGTIEALADHVIRQAPNVAPADVAAEAPARPAIPAALTAASPSEPVLPTPAAPDPTAPLFQQQLFYLSQVAAQNLRSMHELIRQQMAAAGPSGTPAAPPAATTPAAARAVGTAKAPPKDAVAAIRGINLAGAKLSTEQQAFVARLVADHVARTGRSKSMTQDSRAVLADWKHTLSFWGQMKEAKYPIVSARSDGARLWDVDGNEYIDVALGMGVHFFGHRPPFIHDALSRQMECGLELGTQSKLTGTVAQLVHDLTGSERVAFGNTGSEAVMVAIRLARAATGRSRIVIFKNAYHGIFDGVLATEDDEGGVRPIGIGTPPAMIEDVMVMEYGAAESLRLIEQQADSIAAVLVEPVQSRDPDLQPQGFLKALRRITRTAGAALIFDEMITGFRILPGGAQAWFGVRADIVLYGKIVGGGMPIGVIAGAARYLDYIDGGAWAYGDRSAPQSPMIYFGGTFCRNPATMVTAHAALTHMTAEGPALQERVTALTTAFCDRLNRWFETRRVPLRAKHFASQWRLVPLGDKDVQPIELELLYLAMIDRGVYTWERRISFFSTAHTEADVERVFDVLTGCIEEIRAGGFAWSIEAYPEPQFTEPSSVQRRLYALSQREGGQLPYHLPQAFWIDGPLDIERLETAFRTIIGRHESLRTSFVTIEGELLAKRWAEPRFEIERLRASEADIDAAVAAFVRPFDLAVAPLLRVATVEVGPERHLLLADAHHIVADGLSFNVIAAELMALYQGQSLAPVDYDWRLCQQRVDAGGVGDRGTANRSFWSDHLAGDLPVLDLSYDRRRPTEPDFKGDTLTLSLPSDGTRQLRDLARQSGASLYIVLLAAWSTLLHRLTGQEDIVVGGATSGRSDLSMAAAVGMFVNTVAFRTKPRPRQPFRQFLAEVAATSLAVYDHQDYPFEHLLGLVAGRAHDRHPVFDTMLSYENASERAFHIDALTFTQRDVHLAAAMFDLALEVIEEQDGLSLRVSFATSLFERATIEHWVAAFERLLGEIVSDPDRPLGRLPIVGPAGRDLIARFNKTGADYPNGATLLHLFQASVRRHPQRPAVRFGEAVLTYEELDQRSAVLAARLAERVEAGSFVGIFLDRSVHAVVAILAAFKAGCAYVPIDVDHPADLIEHILRDSDCGVVLTSAALAARLPHAMRERALAVDQTARERNSFEARRLEPDAVAYAIYTSGSTGRPKGCLISHRNVVRLMVNRRHDFDFNENDVWLCAHSFAFDFSVWEIWGALAYGGLIVVAGLDEIRDPAARLALIRTQRVSVLNQTPGAFYGLIEAESRAEAHDLANHLRYVIFGGDRLEPGHLKPWAALYPLDRIALINMYGITETTVHVSYHRLRDADIADAGGRSPIGRPLPETTIEVLSPLMEPQPVGAAGEIWVGGSGVGLGYLNKPDLTAERFVERAGQRLYKSGDVGRLRADGVLEYLGRNDHQVQIRGYRVETGAVTHELLGHPEVAKALVVDREGAPGVRELVAYVVERTRGALTVESLRLHLERSLPGYMVPAYFVVVDDFPLTANGKIDRGALPAPEAGRLTEGRGFVQPSGPIETAIAAIWREVLGLSRIGADDNFFAIGGDSIKALQIVSRLHQVGLRASMAQLFAAKSIARLAEAVRPPAEVLAPPPAADAAAGRGEAGLTPIQHWFTETQRQDPGHFTNAVLLAADAPVDGPALQGAVDRLVAHHGALRLFLTEGGARQKVADRVAVPIEIVPLDDITALTAHATNLHGTFDVTRPPLLRIVLYRLPDGDRVLILCHHLVIDGVSWRILLEDLTTAYDALAAGRPAPELAGSRPWLDWPAILQTYARSPQLLSEIAYWRGVETSDVAAVPRDFETTANTVEDGGAVTFSLAAEPSRALLGKAQARLGVRINALLLAGLAIACRKTFGLNRLRIRLEGHGREELAPDADFSRTIGWFTSIFPLLLDVEGADDAATVAKRVEDALSRLPSKGIGYGILKHLTPPELRNGLAFGQAPEIGFNYMGHFSEQSAGGFSLASGDTGATQCPREERQEVIAVESAVIGATLSVTIHYGRHLHSAETMAAFAGAYEEGLLALAGEAPARVPAALLRRLGVADEEVETVLDLSPLQEGLLYHALCGDRTSYFEQFTYHLAGDLEPERFDAAWQALARRHQLLRAAFVDVPGGRPAQVILKDRPIPYEQHDFSGLPAAQQATAVAALAERDRQRGFDLARDPLMRISLVRLGPQDFDVVWSSHHIIADGWSMGILQQELMELYDTVAAGGPSRLPPPPSFARHLDWLAAQDPEPARRHWRQILDGCRALTTLPRTGRADAEQEYAQRKHGFLLSAEDTAGLVRLAGELEVTLNTVVQGLWATLLARHSGSADVVFGAVVSGRPPVLAGVEQMVGLFLQTIPVRARMDAGSTFAALARQLQAQATASEPFHHLPLAELQRLDGVRRTLFDHVVVFENYPIGPSTAGPGFRVDNLRAFEQMHYPFSLVVHPGPQLDVMFTFNGHAFDEALFRAIEGHFRSLVAAVLGDASRPLTEIDLGGDRPQTEPAAPGKTVLDLFERQVMAGPDRRAIECGGRSLSYAALDERANRLAHALVVLDVGPSVPVAIFLRNGIDYVASILAVQKAGGIFVPIDVDQPERRRQKILARIEPRVVVTDEEGQALLDPTDTRTIMWGTEGRLDAAVDNSAEGRPLRRPEPGEPSYVMFTSGSTGEPKAIVASHEALHHFIRWELAELGVRPDVRVSNLAPTTFDVSLRDIFLALAAGGTVCVPDRETRQDLSRLAAWLEEARIEVIHVVPSLFRLLLNEFERSQRRLPRLAHLVFAGESLWGRDVMRVREVLGEGIALRNGYGPTETTLFKCCMAIGTSHIEPGRMVPVGRPIGGTRVVVVKDGRPAAAGALGEIYILPPFRPLGYFRDEAATREAFLPARDLAGVEGLIYRTGDLGRMSADGTLEFCGRLDGQVKVNGIRIELAEIEGAARAIPEIDQVAAVAHKRADGDTAIACYFTEKAPIGPAALRERLALDLPQGMIPQFFVSMEALPLNLNGKVDRRSLPKPEELVEDGMPFEAAADAVEEKVAAIWAQVLGVRRIGATAPFFAVGGDSLRAMRVISRINEAFGGDLTVAAFFKNPTVRGVAALLRETPSPTGLPATSTLPTTSDYPLSHAQRRLWMLAQMGGHPSAYTLPAAYLLEGRLVPERLKKALEAVVARHESLRTAFVEVNDEPRQRIVDDCSFSVEYRDLSALPDAMAEAERLAGENAEHAFDLEQAPLFRASILRLGDERHVLLVNVHHIVSDAWSLGVMVEEVLRLMRGQDLQPLRVQYKDYALREANDLEGPAALATRDWWLETLRDLPERTDLPTDRQWPNFFSFRGERIGLDLPRQAVAALRLLTHDAGTSLFAGLLGLVTVLLNRYSGKSDLLVGTPVANRDDIELESQVGLYVNTIPLRLRLARDASFTSLLASTWSTLTAALDHRNYPFDRLVDALAVPRDIRRPPLFDVMVVFQDGHQRQLELDGVAVRPFGVEPAISKLPLSFEFVETGGGIRLNLEYATDLFNRDRMFRLAEHVQNLLLAVTDDPAGPLAAIDFLGDHERRLVTGKDAAVVQELPDDATVPAMFAAWARAHPKKLAVIYEDTRLTYAELDGRANALARALIEQHGLSKGDMVAVLLERSELLPIVFLGILKAGGVYLPLDPTYPEERLRYMLEDSGAKLAIVGGGRDALPMGQGCRLFNIDGLGNRRARAAGQPALLPGDLAYMIYTSGSTGMPKGVLLEHRGVVNFALAQRREMPIEPRHRILQFAPSSFDASISELIMALLNGATLVVAGLDRIRETATFGAYLRRHRVTVATFPPTYLACLEDEDVAGLEIILSAGEPPRVDQALRLARTHTFVNGYGPTETSICATWHKVDPDKDQDRPIPIGRAIANSEVLILDREGRLVPVGVPGEIHVGGISLARGYHNRPELTEAAFVPHPFRPGERLYRTGDLGAVTADGEIIFLGRRDRQVKVRGHRVETGEVERTLLGHPKVVRAVVSVHNNDLAAYVVLNGDVAWSELRAVLAKRLPDYMFPSHWMRLKRIPLLPNGKVDYAALPAPREPWPEKAQAASPEEALVAGLPSTKAAPTEPAAADGSAEALVIAVWRDVLRRGDIGPDDHFFESGGDSIKAIQVIGCLRRAGHPIDMRSFLEKPTVAALAAHIRDAAHVASPQPSERATKADPPGQGMAVHLTLSETDIDGLLDDD